VSAFGRPISSLGLRDSYLSQPLSQRPSARIDGRASGIKDNGDPTAESTGMGLYGATAATKFPDLIYLPLINRRDSGQGC
jgi:hypothetical protein